MDLLRSLPKTYGIKDANVSEVLRMAVLSARGISSYSESPEMYRLAAPCRLRRRNRAPEAIDLEGVTILY